MKNLYIILILLVILLYASHSKGINFNFEKAEDTDSTILNDNTEADVSVIVAPPDVMPGRSTEITFLNSYGWDTFEATASFGDLSCGNQINHSTIHGNKNESFKWSVNEFSNPYGFIHIKFFNSDGNQVLSHTVFINGQDNIYYKVS